MSAPRYLCSELVVLRINAADYTVNLEEIARVVMAPRSKPKGLSSNGVSMQIRCGPVSFSGKVVDVERHEFGWRVEVEFFH